MATSQVEKGVPVVWENVMRSVLRGKEGISMGRLVLKGFLTEKHLPLLYLNVCVISVCTVIAF